tara:strand:- start:1223 stop:4639 length:3417 start_codon:yes stop_codon:yes gene_type:complete
MGTNKKYWKGLDELNETPEFVASTKSEFPQELSVDQFLAEDKLKESSTGRRDFLKFLGFSVAAATVAACEAPVIKAVPYAVKPEDITPGVANWYASSYYDGESYASVLVKTREGRPIHIKGNKKNGFTNGGTNPRIISSVLSLYDGERLQNPQLNGDPVTWGAADETIMKQLKSSVDKGKKVVLLSNTIISPSTLTIIGELKTGLTGGGVQMAPVEGTAEDTELAAAPVIDNSKFEHVQFDAISYNGMREANLESFGKRSIPDYDFSKAEAIVSVEADFMNSWVLPTQFLGDYMKGRNPDNDWMSRHHQFETNMSITGSNSDVRSMIKPSEQGKVLALLLKEIGGSVSASAEGLSEEVVTNIKLAAIDLKAAKGKSIVVAGSNRKSVQVIVNAINSKLNNYSNTINLNNPINLHQSEDAKMDALVKDMQAGKIGAIISWDTNPVYSYGNAAGFAHGLTKVGLTVSMAKYADETASLFQYICPDSHALESWNDFNPKASHYSVSQPTIRPLHDTRPAAESLMIWSGLASHVGKDSKNYHDYISTVWQKRAYAGQTEYTDFHSYWSATVHNSCVADTVVPATAMPFNGDLNKAVTAEKNVTGVGTEISFYQKAGLGSGIHANNPWLQELPDPITKVTWDNYATMAPSDMEGNYNTGVGQEEQQSVVTITVGDASIDLPVYPQPGQMPGTIGVAYGYGRGANQEKIGKSAYQQNGIYGEASTEMIGANAFLLAKGGVKEAFDASVTDTGNKYILACTQTHSTVMGRNSIMKETTFATYKDEHVDPSHSYNHRHKLHTGWEHEEKLTDEFDLWEEHPVEHVGHRWGMSIDLNLCVGCGSCVVACGSENNVPVVGRDEVRRGREMHWMRIDRYYASDIEATVGTRVPEEFAKEGFGGLKKPADNPKVAHMPMLCQHCNHAPCETVCPVAATTHSNEGLNQMTYNRCIGTRYCANNCPYKVRRFNWFNYPSYRKFTEVNPAQDDLGRMVLNPDVVVRTRGVMEKCSFCVQKIQTGKLVAKKADRPLVDGDVTTACSDVCPSNAITFGDWNDVESQIRKSSEEKRSYQALEEIGVKPNIWYKVKVRNEVNDELVEIQTAHGHGDTHGDDRGGDGHDGGDNRGNGGNHDLDTGHGNGEGDNHGTGH